MWPKLDSTTYPAPRKPAIIRAFFGDSTITSRRPVPGTAVPDDVLVPAAPATALLAVYGPYAQPTSAAGLLIPREHHPEHRPCPKTEYGRQQRISQRTVTGRAATSRIRVTESTGKPPCRARGSPRTSPAREARTRTVPDAETAIAQRTKPIAGNLPDSFRSSDWGRPRSVWSKKAAR
ncbi:hypothetical protein GCM10027269_18510 [Kribbella endophytica]